MMEDPKAYIASGILELYVLDALTPEEEREVQRMVALYPEISAEVDALQSALHDFSIPQPVAPPAGVRSALVTQWTELAEAEAAEKANVPPLLNPGSRPEDYLPWSADPGLKPPEEYENIFYIPIHQSERGLTAMVWMKEGAEEEVHTDQIERFLILEGSCNITVEGKVHELKAGDYLSIPLHLSHFVTVTSPTRCKILLQRIAA